MAIIYKNLKYSLIIILLLISKITIAESNLKILINKYETSYNDSLKLQLLDEIVSIYSDFDTKNAIKYEKLRIQIFHNQENFAEEISGLYKIGMFYYNLSDYENALIFFVKGKDSSKKYKFEKLIFSGNIYIANTYFNSGRIEKAYKYYKTALEKSLKQKNMQNIAYCYNNIGNVCAIDSSYGNAEENYLKSLGIKEKLSDTSSYIKSIGNMCIIYMKAGKYKKALDYGFKALNLCDTKRTDKTIITELYKFIGEIYSRQKKYAKSKIFFEKAIKIATENSYYKLLSETYLYYSNSAENQGKTKEAFSYFKKKCNIEKIIFNKDREKEINRLMVKYETANSLNQNEILQKEINSKADKISHQKTLFAHLISVIILSILIIILLYNRFRLKKGIAEKLEKIVQERTESLKLEIEKHKNTSKKLLKAKEKAEESDRLKSAFLRNISHEIRTPMNGIIGFSNLLKEPWFNSDELSQYFDLIEQSGRRMLNTIDNLIKFSMIESGQTKVNIGDTKIYEKTQQIFNYYEPEVEEKGLMLLLNIPDKTKDILIRTDKQKINSILSILIKNAIKYSQTGIIEFGYKIKTESERKELKFFVKDNGIGIPKAIQETIFESFMQADISETRKFDGSGLGLSICKAYVEMLGGKIWVESIEGKGSSFYFTIPYQAVAEKIFDNKESELKKSSLPEIKPLKILIAEDEESVDMHFNIVLKKFQTQLLHAKTGIEAVEYCRKNPDIDLILMDIKMPEMDGYEATKQIRKFNKNIIIIAQTAYALPGDREKSIEAGCDDYICKPIDRIKLIKMINENLNIKDKGDKYRQLE